VFLHVTRVQPIGRHRLHLEFNEGTGVEIDLREELHGEVFEPLRDPVYLIGPFPGSGSGPGGPHPRPVSNPSNTRCTSSSGSFVIPNAPGGTPSSGRSSAT
jgi:hypothetical protein